MEEVSTVLERPANAPRLLTFKEAMRYGKFGKDKLYSLIAEGKVVAYKDGHATMVDANSIDAHQRSLPRFVARRRVRRKRR